MSSNLYRSFIQAPLAIAVLIAGLAGCAQLTTAPPAAPVVVQAPDPDTYHWETGAIEASGTAKTATEVSGPQRMLGARNAAKVAALKSVKSQVRELAVREDQTLGGIMDKYLAIRRAVEKQLQSAEIIDEHQSGQQYEVKVRLSLKPVADLLRQNSITPTEELPATPVADDTGVAPVT
jgi:hypothetical protein